MANERVLDFFIGGLLKSANIKYTPNGSDIKEIQTALKTASKKGTSKVGFPEFTAKVGNFILVIENKADMEKQAVYDDEKRTILSNSIKALTDFAENGALHYAQQIIQKTNFKKVFAFGCSGDEKHHTIRPIYVDENSYRLLEPIQNFENFNEKNVEQFYREQVLGEMPPKILEKDGLIKKAGELHEALRNYGQLGDKEKPLVVSAILLALQDENFDINSLKGNATQTDGNKIFTSVRNFMLKVDVSPEVKRDKVLRQFNIIRDRTVLNQIDDRLKNPNKKNELAKTPLRYFTEFIKEHILDSIKANAHQDVLGQFYGEFMRYSGGDGQTLGVVLTPDHITELFCDLVQVQPDDMVFDPCCGTGGFLVAAMHRMENLAKTEKKKKHIKSHQLHGIEIREDMFAIATTNMILRDDGKSNLVPDNFLNKTVAELRANKYTVGFMNPPYSQAKGKDTAHLSEIHFIEHLLDSLANGGRCAVIVPQSTMVGKSKVDNQVKKRILQNHTLEGVITLNKETFYRIGVNPCIAIFTAHKKHDPNKYCKFINFEDDGFLIRKHIGIVETEVAKEKKAHLLNIWLHDSPAESRFIVRTTIEPEDEWLHSFYYFNDEIPKETDFEKTIGDYLSFEFSMIMQDRTYLFENAE
ncbi:N-6 DNA methylase [Nemorincola caseinilytica]|uniref:site-specific DNA-methyltransferase (adenine-specific) n=1 Tax=Nemorincola caseinilytica TaxID=2054315 RepID=A0ABP8NMV3_9BACT